MKKNLMMVVLIGGLFVAADAPKTSSNQSSTQADSSVKKKPWMKDQEDQTDTYAIPLDSSEEEEDQEIDTLQKEQRTPSKK